MFRGALTLSVFVLALCLALPVFAAQHDGQKAMEGTIVCVQVDEEGNVQTMTEFTECTGTVVMVGESKAAAVAATKEERKSWFGIKEAKSVSGELQGHTRGYILASSAALGDEGVKEASVSGTIICLLPNYEEGSVAPVVASGPCGAEDPHLHVVTTGGGQVYALHGSEEAIAKIEAMKEKKNVELQGKIQGDQGAWVLYVN